MPPIATAQRCRIAPRAAHAAPYYAMHLPSPFYAACATPLSLFAVAAAMPCCHFHAAKESEKMFLPPFFAIAIFRMPP